MLSHREIVVEGREEWVRFKPVEEEENEEESEDDSKGNWCATFIETPACNTAVIMFIILNTLSLAIECNYPRWDGWFYIELFFLFVFVTELVIKLFAYGCSFFTGADRWWNIFDFVIITTGLIDLFIRLLLPDKVSQRGTFGHFVTIFRVIRCLRVLRSVRLLKQFKQLNLLTVGFFYAMSAAMWMSVAFSLILLIFAIFTTTLIGQHAAEFGEDAAFVEEHFGTLPLSFFTMFQVITLDEWSNMTRKVMKQMPELAPFFMVYIMLMAFTMISLLTGVMAQKITLTAMETNEADKEEAFKNFVRSLEEIFKATDTGAGLRSDKLFEIVFSPEMRKPSIQLRKHGLSLTSHDLSDILRAKDVGPADRVTWPKIEESIRQFMEAGSTKNLFKMRCDIQRLEKMISSMAVAGVPTPPGTSSLGPTLWSPVPSWSPAVIR